MILIFHILVAISSLAYTGYVFLFPSKKALYAAYTLVALTLGSGTVLLLQNPASMRQVCTTGLVYLAAITIGIILVHNKIKQLSK